jgi:hypothetical protein
MASAAAPETDPSTSDAPEGPAPAPFVRRLMEPLRSKSRSTESLRAVYVGIGALVALNGAAVVVFRSSPSTAAAVIGSMSAPIATLVGAYFGIKTGTDAGSSGKAEAEQSRTVSDERALALAGMMDPDTARDVLAALGVPMPAALEAGTVTANAALEERIEQISGLQEQIASRLGVQSASSQPAPS